MSTTISKLSFAIRFPFRYSPRMNTLIHPRIKTSDAIDFFGSKADLARACGVSPQALTKWGEYIPGLRAYQLRDRHPKLKIVQNQITQ